MPTLKVRYGSGWATEFTPSLRVDGVFPDSAPPNIKQIFLYENDDWVRYWPPSTSTYVDYLFAGDNQTVICSPIVYLTAQYSVVGTEDPQDLTGHTIIWEQISGPVVSIFDATTPTAYFINPQNGQDFLFRVTVDKGTPFEISDEVKVANKIGSDINLSLLGGNYAVSGIGYSVFPILQIRESENGWIGDTLPQLEIRWNPNYRSMYGYQQFPHLDTLGMNYYGAKVQRWNGTTWVTESIIVGASPLRYSVSYGFAYRIVSLWNRGGNIAEYIDDPIFVSWSTLAHKNIFVSSKIAMTEAITTREQDNIFRNVPGRTTASDSSSYDAINHVAGAIDVITFQRYRQTAFNVDLFYNETFVSPKDYNGFTRINSYNISRANGTSIGG